MEWLPIESAPKDGTLILAAYDDWYGVVCYCANWVEDGVPMPSWVDQFHDERWMDPDAWQPLPPLPKPPQQRAPNKESP